jgi:hypothetical protein
LNFLAGLNSERNTKYLHKCEWYVSLNKEDVVDSWYKETAGGCMINTYARSEIKDYYCITLKVKVSGSPGRPRFDPRPVPVRTVVNKVVLGQVFL